MGLGPEPRTRAAALVTKAPGPRKEDRQQARDPEGPGPAGRPADPKTTTHYKLTISLQ